MDDIVVIEDDSVKRKMEKTAKNLHKKYSTKRTVNEEKLLKEKKWWQKAISIASTCLLTFLILLSCSMTISISMAKIKGTVPIYGGYGVMKIASGSMVKSGYDIGDTIVTKTVDTNTLKVGDCIAFYVYYKDSRRFSLSKSTKIENNNVKTRTVTPLGSFIGIQPQIMTEAANAGSKLVFHHIYAIYEDKNGERWFKTYGSSNTNESTGQITVDAWTISEKLIVGVIDKTPFANFIASILSFMTNNPYALILGVMIPVILTVLLIGKGFVKDVALAKLELDVVEEKRKLTDEICVKNNIGFNMDKKTKYKVLAQASPEEKNEYISLLWEGGNAPASVRKYYIRKQMLLKHNQKLLELNRECEQMYKNNVDINEITKVYMKQKDLIDKEYQKTLSRINKLKGKVKKEVA